jgi:uncharacterized protein YjeT (DUF2065 family)
MGNERAQNMKESTAAVVLVLEGLVAIAPPVAAQTLPQKQSQTMVEPA